MAQASAGTTIYDYLSDVDEFYYMVVGAQSPAGDASAGMDIALGIQNYNNLEISTVIEGTVSPNLSQILIGHPCENSLINLPCETWPYENGTGLIKVDGNYLIISGTTVDDRRRVAKIINEYPNYPELQQNFFVLVQGNTLVAQELTVERAKSSSEFICGDDICEPGEKYVCFVDCEQKNCNDICQEQGISNSICRKITDPSSPICYADEINKGSKYCTQGRYCCCKTKTVGQIPGEEQPKEPFQQQETENKNVENKLWVVGVISALIIFLLVGYMLIKSPKH